MKDSLLEARDLTVGYRDPAGSTHPAVVDVTLRVRAGEIVGLVGESGCGKSTLARTLVGWRGAGTVVLGGEVVFAGTDLLKLRRSDLRRYWGAKLAYVPQEVSSALNPSRRVRAQLEELLELHTSYDRRGRSARISDLLEEVGIDASSENLSRYPFEFSGGQQQRIALALSMLCEPQVLVLDEPTTGIDANLRQEVFGVLEKLLTRRNVGVVYISHDVLETKSLADHLVIMYAGRVVESGEASEVFQFPRHPYAAALRAAVPTLSDVRMVVGIQGRPPEIAIETRCSFAPRCDYSRPECTRGPIPLTAISPGHDVRCIRAREIDLDSEDARGEVLTFAGAKTDAPLLETLDVTCRYRVRSHELIALSQVSFRLAEGETLGVVGESGSGKSTLLRAIVGLQPPVTGEIRWRGASLSSRARDRSLKDKQAIQLVFQNPDRSLNPRQTVRNLLDAPLRLYEPGLSRSQRADRCTSLLEQVHLSSRLMNRFPHQLSGGEKQRVALARAFAARPSLLLCDEVVSALDVSVQATIMNLIRDHSKETGAAVIFVTHDLSVVRMMADKIIVLREGLVREIADTQQLFMAPRDPYTVRLLESMISPELEASSNGNSGGVWARRDRQVRPKNAE